MLELPCPFKTEIGAIRLIEPTDCDITALLAKILCGDYDKPFVIDNGDTRTLHFSLIYTQSRMRTADPWALELDYTRHMMAFLLFVPRPQRILMLGLGGGSLAKFCYRHLPGATITAVEISADVIAFRDQFALPPDDPRFAILHADAVEHVATTADKSDVIMIDAFDRHGAASASCTGQFYADVRRRLCGSGVAVVNFASEREQREGYLAALREAFDENVVTLQVPEDGNTIAFAFRDAAFEPRWRWITGQAKVLQKRLGLDFPRFAERLNKNRKSGFWQRLGLD